MPLGLFGLVHQNAEWLSFGDTRCAGTLFSENCMPTVPQGMQVKSVPCSAELRSQHCYNQVHTTSCWLEALAEQVCKMLLSHTLLLHQCLLLSRTADIWKCNYVITSLIQIENGENRLKTCVSPYLGWSCWITSAICNIFLIFEFSRLHGISDQNSNKILK